MTPLSNERLAELIALHPANNYVGAALRELQSARERVAGLEQDAKRYRWLRDHWGNVMTCWRVVVAGADVNEVESVSLWDKDEPPLARSNGLDAALDNAMEGE